VLVTSAEPVLARRMAEHLGIAEVHTGQGSEAPGPPVGWRWIPRALRPYQWLKNALVFVPFLLSHQVGDGAKWVAAALLFWAFSLCASAGYVVNDILDRRQDRLHPRRRLRPIASGAAPLGQAIWLPLPLLALAALCCAFLPPACGLALAAYLLMTSLYSTVVKNIVVADVLLLAFLYLLRLLAGSFATGNLVSHWLLAFALTLFLSLALCKRVSELSVWRSIDYGSAPGRKYRSDDIPVLQMMAVSSGFLACLIMVLYIQSPEILRLYRRPECLWVGVVALLYWLGRLFIYSHRGECPDDPLLFAVQDKTTLVVLAVAGAFALFAV
jgi:4-hydroxybenzoate polyprenyltransferase